MKTDKSSKECRALNEANKDAIAVGVMEEFEPSDYILQQERAAKLAKSFKCDCYVEQYNGNGHDRTPATTK